LNYVSTLFHIMKVSGVQNKTKQVIVFFYRHIKIIICVPMKAIIQFYNDIRVNK